MPRPVQGERKKLSEGPRKAYDIEVLADKREQTGATPFLKEYSKG
jgi:hypothetical protein